MHSTKRYEAGEYLPSDDTLAKIADTLNFFFGRGFGEPEPDITSFRALKKMTAAQRDMALGEGAIALHLNKFIESQFELPQADLPDSSREPSPEAAAESLRRYWGIDELEVRRRHRSAKVPTPGRFTTLSIGGNTLLKGSEVQEFEPKSPGRPPKTKQSKPRNTH